MSFERLEQVQMQKNKLQAQLILSKGINRIKQMSEAAKTQRMLEAANISLEQTPHGLIIPSTTVASKVLYRQGVILQGAQRQAKEIGTGYSRAVIHEENLTERYQEKLGDILNLEDTIAQLRKDLKNKKGNIFDWNLPSIDNLKTPLLMVGGALVGVYILGKVLGGGK